MSDDKLKELEGSYSVNGDVTPITHKPIDQLDATEWVNMTDGELIDQRQALYNRMVLAQSNGMGAYVPAMKQGLLMLDQLLKERGVGESTHLI